VILKYMKHFKLLPLLVFVAMLAFSVRLVDVVTGFKTLSGAAYAEAPKPQEVAAVEPPKGDLKEPTEEKPAETPEAAKEENAEEKPAEQEAAKEKKPKPLTIVEGEGEEWHDPADEDPAYAEIKEEVFKDMAKRRQELDKREKELVTREALLQAAEKEIDRKYQELSQLRVEIEKLLGTQSEEEKARIASLVKIYEGMKPADAARIFDTLDLDVLVAVVGQMSERKLSPVLAEMDPERARTITIMLAGQKQLPELPQPENN
jgi:flagellar motility protein MotE (MotC chaperone)